MQRFLVWALGLLCPLCIWALSVFAVVIAHKRKARFAHFSDREKCKQVSGPEASQTTGGVNRTANLPVVATPASIPSFTVFVLQFFRKRRPYQVEVNSDGIRFRAHDGGQEIFVPRSTASSVVAIAREEIRVAGASNEKRTFHVMPFGDRWEQELNLARLWTWIKRLSDADVQRLCSCIRSTEQESAKVASEDARTAILWNKYQAERYTNDVEPIKEPGVAAATVGLVFYSAIGVICILFGGWPIKICGFGCVGKAIHSLVIVIRHGES